MTFKEFYQQQVQVNEDLSKVGKYVPHALAGAAVVGAATTSPMQVKDAVQQAEEILQRIPQDTVNAAVLAARDRVQGEINAIKHGRAKHAGDVAKTVEATRVPTEDLKKAMKDLVHALRGA